MTDEEWLARHAASIGLDGYHSDDEGDEHPYSMPQEHLHMSGFGGAVKSCSGGAIPEMKLALERSRCLRTGTSEKLTNSKTVGEFLARHFGCQPQEQFLAIGLNTRSEVLGVLDVGTGGLDSAAVDPRVMFAGLVLMGASAFIICHNHPSGDPTPSRQDVELTRQINRGGEILNMRLLDHVVVGSSGEMSSMASSGPLPR